jgi:uncharacterized protein YbbK (DUF523 family)
MDKKRYLVSACILGEYCRYDGATKQIDSVLRFLSEYDVVVFCPEAPLFGTPRERINVVDVDGENRILTDISNVDVTNKLRAYIEDFLKDTKDIDGIILKSKSPSCGYKTTPVLDKNKTILRYENGIGADIISKYYKDIEIKDENSFE